MDLDYEWAKDTPRKRLSTPYTFKENLVWLKNNLLGPSKKFKTLIPFIPQKITLNTITPKYRLGFLGDIMDMGTKDLQIESAVREFFKDVDFLIGNFEGTVSKAKKVFMAQAHSESILSVLEALFPPSKFVLSCANNHAGDFGWSEFNQSYQKLKQHGFIVIGRKDEPSILLEDSINVTSCTNWSNQPDTQYINYFNRIEELFNQEADCNILFPHWGYEMQLYPNPKQIEMGKLLLAKWNFIVGHHSHVPQPITSYEVDHLQKLLAYSLGDFCSGLGLKKYRHGIVLKAELGPNKNGQWQVGNMTWSFTRIHKIDKKTMEVRLEDICNYFSDKISNNS